MRDLFGDRERAHRNEGTGKHIDKSTGKPIDKPIDKPTGKLDGWNEVQKGDNFYNELY